jgi:hypothetical protein
MYVTDDSYLVVFISASEIPERKLSTIPLKIRVLSTTSFIPIILGLIVLRKEFYNKLLTEGKTNYI